MKTSEYAKHSSAFRTINSTWDYINSKVPAPVEGYWNHEAIVDVAVEIYNFRTEKQIQLDDEECTFVNDYAKMIGSLLVARSISNEDFLNAIRN